MRYYVPARIDCYSTPATLIRPFTTSDLGLGEGVYMKSP